MPTKKKRSRFSASEALRYSSAVVETFPSFPEQNNVNPKNMIIIVFFNVIKVQLCKFNSKKIMAWKRVVPCSGFIT